MDCPSCHAENAPDARFCAECGHRLRSPEEKPDHRDGEGDRGGGATGGGDADDSTEGTSQGHRQAEPGAAEVAASGPTWLVGRSDAADVQIDLPSVSWEHLAVRQVAGALRVRDLGSTNGTWYAAGGADPSALRPVGDPEQPVEPTGVLMLGSHRLPVSLLRERLGLVERRPVPATLTLEDRPKAKAEKRPDAEADGAGAEGTEPDERGKPVRAVEARVPLLVGRDPTCDVVLDDPLVSRRHVRVSREAGGWHVEDLGSINGTWYQGRRLSDGRLPETAVLNLGSWEIHLSAEALRPEPLRGQIRLDVEGVVKEVPNVEAPLVRDVTFSVFPSEIVGILGDSGAGKTTLLQVIAAVEHVTDGTVRLNGESIIDHFDRFRGLIGYVPQDDIVHPDLTVWQALYYSARLRLPADTTEAEIARRIEDVLAVLDLGDRRDVRIGDVREKTLSGGQRKRVNLGMELVTDPLILFADEPTSGLSYRDSEEVLHALRQVADKGRPVVISIHQPSGTLYRKLDLALILGQGGRLAYYGPTCPDSFRFFEASEGQPETLFRRLGERPLVEWIRRYEESDTRRRWVKRRQGRELPEAAHPPRRRQTMAGARTLATLVARLFRLRLGSARSWARYLAAPAVILALLLVMYAGVTDPGKPLLKRANPLFFLSMSALFFGLFNAATELVAERPIFRRERLAGLGLGPYLLSKAVVLSTVTALQVLALGVPALLLLGFDGSLAWHLAALLLTGWGAVGTGLLLSSLAPRPESALILVPIVLIAQLMLSGFIEPVKGPAKQALATPMVVRWSAELMMHTEHDSLGREPAPLTGITPRALWRSLYIDRQGYSFASQARSAGLVALVGLLYLLAAALALRMQDPAVLRREREGYSGDLW